MRVQNLKNILDKVQHSRASFDKYIRMLHRTYEESSYDEFFEEYVTVLLNLFVTDTKIKNVYVQRTLEFMAKFATSFCTNDADHIFYIQLIQESLKYHNASNPDVRFRVCEFIKFLLNSIGDANLDDDLCDDISIAMQERMNDVKANVRLQAVIASQRLQDPNNKEDPILTTYIKSVNTESNPLIRKAIIDYIAINIKTVHLLLERCLDSNDSVRLAVFKKISGIPVKLFKIDQRQFILRNGLRLDTKVVEFIKSSLLPKWLSRYEDNYLEFCKALRLDATEDEFKSSIELLEEVLVPIFNLRPMNELKDILNLNDSKIPTVVSFESILYWRCLVDFFTSNTNDYGECLEQVLPDLMCLIEYTENYYKKLKVIESEWEQLKENQIFNQLLKIIFNYEMLDTSERLRTRNFITNMLSEATLSYDNILLLTKIFEKIEPDVDIRSQEICTIISSIKDPLIITQTIEPSADNLLKRDLRIAPLRVKLNVKKDDMHTAILKQEFQEADHLKNEINLIEKQIEDIKKEFTSTTVSKIPKNDQQTISKCMDVLIAFLNSPKVNELNIALRSNMDNFVKTSLIDSVDINSDFKALKCYGLMCIIDKKEAHSAIQIFCQQLLFYRYHGTYNLSGINISASVVTDFLLLYGVNIFGENINVEFEKIRKGNKKSLYDTTRIDDSLPDRSTDATIQDVVEIFLDMLDDPSQDLRELGGGCLIKLLYHNVIKSSNVLSKLIIKWFNPATEKDVKLRQMLGIFFSNYVLKVPESLAMLEKAFIPTLNIVINAPQNSPLIDIDIDAMLKVLVDIIRPHHQKFDQGLEVHKNLALQLCNEICNKPQGNCTSLYIRTLTYLDPPYDDSIIFQDLKNSAKKILTLLHPSNQKHLKKQVEKYLSKLNNIEIELAHSNIEDPSNIAEGNLADEVRNLSVISGKRKRDSSVNSGKLKSVSDDNENESDEDLLIEQVTSDDDSANSDNKQTKPTSCTPEKMVRRSTRLRN